MTGVFKHIRVLIMALIGMLSLAGCDDGGGDDQDNGPPTVDVSGVWTGSSTDAQGSVRWRSNIRFDLQQHPDGTVQGTVKVSTTESATGVVHGEVLTLNVHYANSVIGSIGTYRMRIAGSSMSGRYHESQWPDDKYKDVVATRTGS